MISKESRPVSPSLTSLSGAAPSHALGSTIPFPRCPCEAPPHRKLTGSPRLSPTPLRLCFPLCHLTGSQNHKPAQFERHHKRSLGPVFHEKKEPRWGYLTSCPVALVIGYYHDLHQVVAMNDCLHCKKIVLILYQEESPTCTHCSLTSLCSSF